MSKWVNGLHTDTLSITGHLVQESQPGSTTVRNLQNTNAGFIFF